MQPVPKAVSQWLSWLTKLRQRRTSHKQPDFVSLLRYFNMVCRNIDHRGFRAEGRLPGMGASDRGI